MVAQRRTGSMMRRSFPQMHLIPVVVVWAETRASMGCRPEYEGEWGKVWLPSCPEGIQLNKLNTRRIKAKGWTGTCARPL
jgi:hypothetical protein